FFLNATSGSITTTGSSAAIAGASGSLANLVLVSTGSITAGATAPVNASGLTLNATGGSVNVTDSATTVTLQNCPTCGSFTGTTNSANTSTGTYALSAPT